VRAERRRAARARQRSLAAAAPARAGAVRRFCALRRGAHAVAARCVERSGTDVGGVFVLRASRRSNLLDCTFEVCSLAACCYHQECLERYLKSIRCERCVRGAPLQGLTVQNGEQQLCLGGPRFAPKPPPPPRTRLTAVAPAALARAQ
jgi:hypothetical protein